jgi:hypothetical protein
MRRFFFLKSDYCKQLNYSWINGARSAGKKLILWWCPEFGVGEFNGV